MNAETNYEGEVIIQMHLNGGFTKVIWKNTIGIGLADGGIITDIPTSTIPLNLRKIGSRFYLKVKGQQIEIEEITEIKRL